MIWRFLLVVVVSCVVANGFPDHDSMRTAKLDANQETDEYIAEENLGDDKVVEGDIMVDNNIRAIMSNLNTRDAITNSVKHWPGGRVPYIFGSASSSARSAFQAAINDYHRYTCIRIVPRTNEQNYIYVVSEGGCWSYIGKTGGQQKLSLGPGCEHKGTSIHELMHALGFFHEQSRLDRDSYITIVWSNIRSGMENNFKKYGHGEADTLGAPYDYGSIMHYPSKAFSTNGQSTITTKRSGVHFGQRSGFSEIDLQQINKLYKCGGVVTTTRPKPTTRPPVVSCSDDPRYSAKCPGWARFGYCSPSHKHGKFMRTYCKTSCGLCGKVSCSDDPKYRSKCPNWARYGYCSPSHRYGYFMRTYCKTSCGFCGKVSCSDDPKYRSKCPGWARYGYCSPSHKHGKFMRTYCKTSCGLCGKVSCKDNRRECPGWRRYCPRGNRFYSYMMKECKKTCGKC